LIQLYWQVGAYISDKIESARNGGKASWHNSLPIWPRVSLDCVVLPAEIYSACGSFTRLTEVTK
jgi:hypothetical protein